MRREIVSRIIEILKNDAELAEKVKYFYFGRPVKALDWPFIVVEPAAIGGDNIAERAHGYWRHVFRVNILIYARSVVPDEAEKEALDLAEHALGVIMAGDVTELVKLRSTFNIYPVALNPEPPLAEGEYLVVIQRLTLEAWWLE
ncbi:MAG: hypothetical protein QW334_00250 [Thermofilum sp.]